MPTGASVAYVAGDGHLDLPRAQGGYRATHQVPAPRPVGLDWTALRPKCRECATPSSEVNRDGLCPACNPDAAVVDVPRPPKKRKAKKAKTPKPRRTAKAKKTPKQPRPVRKPRRIMVKGPSDYATRREALEVSIVADYKSGHYLVSELAEKYDRSRVYIRRLLDTRGVPRVDERTLNSGGQRREYDATTIAEVRRLYVDERLSRAKVAEQLRLPYKTVVTIMGREGIQARKGETGRMDGSASLKQRIADSGSTCAEIKAWGLAQGLLLEQQPGIPPARIVDAFIASGAARVEGRPACPAS